MGGEKAVMVTTVVHSDKSFPSARDHLTGKWWSTYAVNNVFLFSICSGEIQLQSFD